MARKRKIRGEKEKKEIKIKDPDPTSEDYVYDEVEKFHRSKDKILLDPTKDDDDSDLEEDEENEEVLGLNSSEEDSELDEEDKENEEVGEGSSSDVELNPDDGLPSDKAWGKSKNVFYNADVDDEDIEASDEEAQMAADEEEKEAMTLQKRMAEKLDADDFYMVDDEIVDDKEQDDQKAKETAVTKDLSKLSKREKLDILVKESPELLPLLEEYKDRLAEVKDKYHPLLLLVKNGTIKSKEGILYVQTKHQLLLNYLVNMSFYLALKASKDNVKAHPVIDILVQHKQLLSQMEPLDERLAPEIESLLAKNKDEGIKSKKSKSHSNELIEILQHKPTKKVKKEKIKVDDDAEMDIDPLEYYNSIKAQKEMQKTKTTEESDGDGEGEEYELDEDGKRRITYQISKNKGLTRKRRKELKNPRVKHKMKFKRAKIKHKGQVREVQREISRYGGESTGIKSSLSRSIKIK